MAIEIGLAIVITLVFEIMAKVMVMVQYIRWMTVLIKFGVD